ncbi:MAG: hypothetical protein M3Z56_10270 [Bacteroidota bacterium]|nr:hypothetical protein [Bacteroidota bacterium]
MKLLSTDTRPHKSLSAYLRQDENNDIKTTLKYLHVTNKDLEKNIFEKKYRWMFVLSEIQT